MRLGERNEHIITSEDEFYKVLKSVFGIELDGEQGKYNLNLELSKGAPVTVWTAL